MPGDGPAEALLHGVRRAVRTDATAFGYSILVTATFGAITLVQPPVTIPRLFAFVFGATGGFALWEAIATRGFTLRIREERSSVVLLGTALAPISVGLALGVALLVTHLVHGALAWALGSLSATIAYVAIAGAQLALAREYERRNPPEESE